MGRSISNILKTNRLFFKELNYDGFFVFSKPVRISFVTEFILLKTDRSLLFSKPSGKKGPELIA